MHDLLCIGIIDIIERENAFYIRYRDKRRILRSFFKR